MNPNPAISSIIAYYIYHNDEIPVPNPEWVRNWIWNEHYYDTN